MKTTIRYIVLTAVRDWLFVGLFVALFAAFGLASFLGTTALVEGLQHTTTYTAGATRIILHIGLIVFGVFHVRRAFDNREIEVMISRPISRPAFVIAYWLGFFVVALWLIIPLLAAMAGLLQVNLEGLLYWGASLVLEAAIILAFVLFTALIMRSAVSAVLLSFGFYFLARMMGFFTYVLDKPASEAVTLKNLMRQMLEMVSSVVPRLDLFAKSEWLIYGVGQSMDIWLFVTQVAIAVPLLLLMAIVDFKRKQF